MHTDWLSLVESAEVGAERAESMLRRHGRLILTTAAVAAATVALFVAPSLDTAAQTDASRLPSPAAAARPSPPAAATRSPGAAPPSGKRRTRENAPPSALTATASAAPIYVHVAGAVAHAGVVRLPASARAFDAVRAAGGLMPDADLDRVNLSVRLRDEAMVTIPHRRPEAPPASHDDREPAADVPPQPAPDEPTPEASELPSETNVPTPLVGKTPLESLWQRPLSLHTATADDLQRVPGIGPGLARAVVTYRARHGGFRSVAELRRVPRFGPQLFARVHRCFVL